MKKFIIILSLLTLTLGSAFGETSGSGAKGAKVGAALGATAGAYYGLKTSAELFFGSLGHVAAADVVVGVAAPIVIATAAGALIGYLVGKSIYNKNADKVGEVVGGSVKLAVNTSNRALETVSDFLIRRSGVIRNAAFTQ